MKTKKCKHCQSEIPANAKVCAQCGRKQGGKLKWIIIGVVVLALIGAVAGGGGSSDSAEPTAGPSASTAAETPEKEQSKEKAPVKEETPAEQPVEYTAYSVNEMMADLDNNAASASDKYKGQNLEITGRLSNIDSDGKYIELTSDEEFSFIGVQCNLKTDEQKEIVKQFSKDQTVTVRGKCTDVGEVLGYWLDVDSIG